MDKLNVRYGYSAVQHPATEPPPGWSVSASYSRADGGVILASADIVQLLVTLQSSGLLDWVQGKSFDALWAYLTDWHSEVEPKSMTMEVVDPDGGRARVVIPPNVGRDPLKRVAVEMRRQVLEHGGSDTTVLVKIESE